LDGPVGGLALRTVGIGVVVIDGVGVGVGGGLGQVGASVASGLGHGVLGGGSGGGQEDEALLPVGRLHVGAVIAGAGGGQLEGLDGEGEILVVGVVDEEPVVDVLLETLCVVAGGDERTGLPGREALLDPRGLGQSLVVRLHSIHHDPPLAGSVDCPEGHDVAGLGGTQVSLLHQLLQSLYTVLRVGQNILVDGLDALVVVLEHSGPWGNCWQPGLAAVRLELLRSLKSLQELLT
jgi:hypothetical protein